MNMSSTHRVIMRLSLPVIANDNLKKELIFKSVFPTAFFLFLSIFLVPSERNISGSFPVNIVVGLHFVFLIMKCVCRGMKSEGIWSSIVIYDWLWAFIFLMLLLVRFASLFLAFKNNVCYSCVHALRAYFVYLFCLFKRVYFISLRPFLYLMSLLLCIFFG